MNVIVPLAGPDFIGTDGSIKALTLFQGKPLLKHALDSRPWASKIIRYLFVLYDCKQTRNFANKYLINWYQNCSIVYISSYSRGAAISILAGLSMLDTFSKPIIIDLADIYYKSSMDIEDELRKNSNIGGIALTFRSNNPRYSYLKLDKRSKVIRAVEKKVISDHASAGTYIFSDCATVLNAISHAISDENNQTHNNLFYVCPLFNGVIAQGKQVLTKSVFEIEDIKNLG